MHISVLLWETAAFCDVIRWLELRKLVSVCHDYHQPEDWNFEPWLYFFSQMYSNRSQSSVTWPSLFCFRNTYFILFKFDMLFFRAAQQKQSQLY